MAEIDSIRYEHFEVYVRADGSPWELGRGAMGVTYKAYDTNLHVDVALKVISEKCFANPTARKRFEREARAAAKLRHPNIAGVYFFGSSESDCHYAMELVDGETVEQAVLRNGAMETSKALEIALQVSRALGAAEKRNIVHRDLKPANIMLTEVDGELLVKVIDFGLAKQLGNPRDAGLTIRGFVGTPHFASPEQLNEQVLDQRSDIYSLGTTLWYMLVGKPPFNGTIVQIVSQHLNAPLPVDLLASQPPAVRALLETMMAKDPANRPQTAGELRRRIIATLSVVDPDRNFEGEGLAISSNETVDTVIAETTAAPTEVPTNATIREVTLPLRSSPHGRRNRSNSRTARKPLLRRPILVACVAAILTCIAAIFGWLFPGPETVTHTQPAVEPEIRLQSHAATVKVTSRVDAAWEAGDRAEAISLAALELPSNSDSAKRLDEMVKQAVHEDPRLESPKLRNALLDAAESGSPPAMLSVADWVYVSHPHWAIFWYEKAARAGSVPAMVRLAHLFADGAYGVPRDIDRAFSWYERAAAAGDPKSMMFLAASLENGRGVKADLSSAEKWYRAAARAGNPKAMKWCHDHGITYYNGN